MVMCTSAHRDATPIPTPGWNEENREIEGINNPKEFSVVDEYYGTYGEDEVFASTVKMFSYGISDRGIASQFATNPIPAILAVSRL